MGHILLCVLGLFCEYICHLFHFLTFSVRLIDRLIYGCFTQMSSVAYLAFATMHVQHLVQAVVTNIRDYFICFFCL